MPRESRSIRLDTRVWAVIDFLADKSGIPFQRWLERYFFDRGKVEGMIDPNEKYPPDRRGGRKAGAGRKKRDRPPQ